MADCVLCDKSDEEVRQHLAERKGGNVCDDCFEEAAAIIEAELEAAD